MKLLAEIKKDEALDLMVEGEGESKKHYLKGLFLEFDAKNRNGRIYRSEFHDPAVRSYMNEKMKEGRGWGELDHPDGATINLKNVSHRIVEMWKDGTNWMGKSIICNTPMGQVVKGLLESGGTAGSSSRGVGSVSSIEEGVLEVQRDYKIITPSDIVSDPSAHGALMQGIMENVEYFFDDKTGTFLPEQAETLRRDLKKKSLNEIQDQKAMLFENFIKALRYNK